MDKFTHELRYRDENNTLLCRGFYSEEKAKDFYKKNRKKNPKGFKSGLVRLNPYP